MATIGPLVSLGELCPRVGFTGLRGWHMIALHDALRVDPPIVPPTPKPPVEEIYRDRIHRWQQGGAVPKEQLLRNLEPLQVITVPTLQLLDHVTVDEPNRSYHDQSWPNPIEWRWTHYRFAFTVFWARLYFESNYALANPDYLWRMLEIAAGYCEFLTTSRSAINQLRRRGVALALYERILGAEFDMRTGTPHHLRHIVNREDLSPDEQRERPEYFRRALYFLREQVEQELAMT